MLLGIDRLLKDELLREPLSGKRLALLAHPASMTGDFAHAIDAIAAAGLELSCAFGPQHGMKGEKQDNMVESENDIDPALGIPVFSLYGEVRRPTDAMMDRFDVLLIDVQDLGTRVYTFLTTLLYVLEAAAKKKKPVFLLDRPNPVGRPIEGSALRPGWESFVGAGPLPMRHGLTLGEAALWFKKHFRLDVDLNVVAMQGYDPAASPGYGWPAGEFPWVNPSPNAATLSMARCYPGTVLIEGTHLSEGRGTTHPLEIVGAPDLNMRKILAKMAALAPEWIQGCRLRHAYFQPTFHKHSGKICEGMQIHVDDRAYDHAAFRPYRLIALWLKAIRVTYPDYEIWRDFPYEYETSRLAIDVINGGPSLREWVDDKCATPADFDALLKPDERSWQKTRAGFLLY
jgi:uncharacterized protein YbbC (DUF1343 family)